MSNMEMNELPSESEWRNEDDYEFVRETDGEYNRDDGRYDVWEEDNGDVEEDESDVDSRMILLF
ncbi:hypothetical protein A2U01_0011149 [Trifolium medium]|uniref:Uncharacterized protein n=1 Tax=Trifolium medium TaxID=97028 RepID=A0A392MU80_9FABA|nr:hypothetical protein [Trifolium medium]